MLRSKNIWENTTQQSFKASLVEKYQKQTPFVEAVFDEMAETKFEGYTTLQELDFDIGIRACIMQAMTDVANKDLFQYAESIQAIRAKCPYAIWEKKPLKLVVANPEECTATAALEQLFKYGAELDCERITDACVLRGVAQAFTANQMAHLFNDIYTKKHPLELKHYPWREKPDLTFANLPITFINRHKENLLPGDRRYFSNLENYLLYNSGGYASGEHSLYMGQKLYSSLDFQLFDEHQVTNFLVDHFDHKQAAYENYLNEFFHHTDKFIPWETLYPKMSANAVKTLRDEYAGILKEYKNKILPETLTAENVETHKEKLLDHFFQTVATRIEKINEEKYSLVRRIDVPKLLRLIHSMQEITESKNRHTP